MGLPDAPRSLAALVLAGGAGSRMGGADKPRLELGGSTLLDRCVAAASAAGCEPVVIVGREVGGGPVAALADGLGRVPGATEVVLLAGDLVHPDRVLGLLGGPAGADGAILADPDGREQWLAGRYRTAALRGALAALGEPSGASLRRLLAGLELAVVPADRDAIADVDTWEDYERAKGAEHG